jgi:hypothetical protein
MWSNSVYSYITFPYDLHEVTETELSLHITVYSTKNLTGIKNLQLLLETNFNMVIKKKEK